MFEPTYDTEVVMTHLEANPTHVADAFRISKEIRNLLNEKSAVGFDFVHAIPISAKQATWEIVENQPPVSETGSIILIFREREPEEERENTDDD